MSIAEKSSTGLTPTAAAALCYVGWWVSGLLMLVIERESSFVKFHAAQAVVALGGIWLAGLLLWLFAFAALFASATAFTALLYVSYVLWGAGIVVWALCLLRAWQGEMWELPVAGPIARRLSGS